MMRRREFVTLLGGAAAGWPLAARAQQQRALPVIGFLDSTTAAARANRVSGFRQGLNQVGFVDGRNVAIEFRWAEGQLDQLPALTADIVRRPVDAIMADGPFVAAVKAATSTIPIVFVTGADPVAGGYVTSLNQPGGNVTGVSFFAAAVSPKRLALLDELVPKPTVIAYLMDTIASQSEADLRAVEAAARALGRQVPTEKAASEREFEAAFARIIRAGAGALFVGAGPFLYSQRRQLVALAARHGLLASYPWREAVEIGGLMSYGASITDACRRAGNYVGRILKGEKPSDLPVELPTKYELVLNLATAKALGLTVSPTLLALADEVIE
jgi:putative ABC transport system substrate-binding protein